MRGTGRGDYINPKCSQFSQERIVKRDEGIAKRFEELEKEVPEGINNFQLLSNLFESLDNGKIMQNFA